MENKTEFIKGLFCNKPHENAPEFVKADIGIKVADFIEYLKANEKQSGYVNFQILESKDGKTYMKLNDWSPDKAKAEVNQKFDEIDSIEPDQIPF